MMKYFAIGTSIRTGASLPSGAVELTEAEYRSTIDAMIAGQEVIVIDGSLVIRDRAPSPGHTWEDGEWVAPPEPEPEPEPTPQSITMRQLRIGLVMAEWITEAEAVAWRKGESLPAPVQAVIDAMPAEQRFIAEETAFIMSSAYRNDPLLIAAAQAAMPDATEQEISDALDQAFREWSQI